MTFENDLNWSKKMQLKLKDFYKSKAFEGRYVFIDKGDKYLSIGSEDFQKKYGADTVMQIDDYESILIEEKFRTRRFNDIIIETMSCTVENREKIGWIYTSKADILNYVMKDGSSLHCYIIHMRKLKKWFLNNKDNYKEKQTSQINKTRFSIVPLSDIERFIGFEYFKVI